MRAPTRPPRVEWRMVAITAIEPVEYAKQMQEALNALSAEGFNVLAQYGRGVGQIIMASRQVADPPHPPGPIPGPTMPPPPPQQPMARLRVQSTGLLEERFVYHFISPEGPQEQVFTSMVEALRVVRAHVDGDGTLVPAYLVTMSFCTYEPPQLGQLLKAYANDIAAQPPKQVD
jgi:hypothetical protein